MRLSIELAVRDFIEYKVLRRGSTKTTEITYRSILKDFVARVPINYVDELTLDVIDRYIDEVARQNFKPKTFKNKVVVVRSFVRFLYSKDLTNIRPESIELPKTPDVEASFLDYDEQRCLINAAYDTRCKAIILTLISSGLRVSELCELKVDDLFERSIVVRRGKGGKARVTFITEECERAIQEYLASKNYTTYLFTNHFGDKLSRQYVTLTVKRCAENSTIRKRVSPHTLRHTFATNLLRMGARIEDVQPMMGHASISTTRIYMHFTNDYLHKRYDAIMENAETAKSLLT